MKRRDLLLADLKAKSLMRRVMEKHMRDFMLIQQMQQMQTEQNATQTNQQTPPALPPDQRAGYGGDNGSTR